MRNELAVAAVALAARLSRALRPRDPAAAHAPGRGHRHDAAPLRRAARGVRADAQRRADAIQRTPALGHARPRATTPSRWCARSRCPRANGCARRDRARHRGNGAPIVATVGLSESETNHIARMGFPDYRGARAIEVAFSGDLVGARGGGPGPRGPRHAAARRRRAAEPARRPDARRKAAGSARRTSTPSTSLVRAARPPISRALNLREAGRRARSSTCSRTSSTGSRSRRPRARDRPGRACQPAALAARRRRRPAHALNARIGILAADGVLLELAKRLRAVSTASTTPSDSAAASSPSSARAPRPWTRASSSSRSAPSSRPPDRRRRRRLRLRRGRRAR